METEPDRPTLESDGNRSPSVRWWPLVLLVLIAVGALAFVWSSDQFYRQKKNELTVLIGFASFVLFLCWVTLFSRIGWKVRGAFLGGTAVLILFAVLTLKIEGVSGDLVPIVTWKWSKLPSEKILAATESRIKTDAQIDSRELPDNFSDYPQFLGPWRTAIIQGPVFETDWKSNPPQELWRRPIGPAWSGFAIKGWRAVTQEQRGGQETVTCYDLLTGELLWTHSDEAHYNETIAGEGPRATPTINDEKVFTLGATGILNCLELNSGRLVWAKNIIEENGARVPEWGLAGSPLVVENLVIVNAGGPKNRALVAYEKANGQFVWSGGRDPAGYSSPFLTTLAGKEQVLIFNQNGIASHDLEDGKVLWFHPWKSDHPHVAMPLVFGNDRVMISSGYGTGSEMLRIDKDAAGKFDVTSLWRSRRLKSKFNNMIQKDGFVYGLDDGILVCLDASNGERAWKEGRYGHGQMILANPQQMILISESGEAILMAPNPQEPTVLSRFSVFDEKTWNPPALAGDFLPLRNHKEAACYKLPVQKSTNSLVQNRRPKPE